MHLWRKDAFVLFTRATPMVGRLPTLLLLASLIGGGAGCTSGEPPTAEPPAPQPSEPEKPTNLWVAAEELALQEEVLLYLIEQLGPLKADLLDLRAPGAQSGPLFAEELSVTGIASVGAAEPAPGIPPHLRISAVSVRVASSPRTVAASDSAPLGPLLRSFDWIELASIHVPRGQFLDAKATRFRTSVDLELRGRAGGALRYAQVQFDLDWARGPVPTVTQGAKPEPGAWRVHTWTTLGATVHERAQPLFREVLSSVIPDPAQLAAAQRSRHEELVEDAIEQKAKFTLPHKYWDPSSHDRHPGLAVADVNGDGHDDIYVTARWGRNQLLLATGNGTFVESAAALGLDVHGHTAAPLFVDLDNDGDLDVFLGRTVERSLLMLQGPDGRFVSRPELAKEPLPMLVSSVSAADVNRDGLLDLYVSTYALHSGKGSDPELPQPDEEEEQRRLKAHHPIHNAYGPPNLLLINKGGGRLERSDAAPTIWRHTYQSTFADWDADGDPDLYVVNDYAENVALRNRGDGTFEDATAELGVGDIGFGMGATFGDYDQDGRQDLYVSNMFSNAGRRATSALPGLDPRFAKMARGNTLFRNDGARFEAVSGLEPPALQVEKTGWSWGGRFVDVDNDGAEDLAVLNGYFTAPGRVAKPVDI